MAKNVRIYIPGGIVGGMGVDREGRTSLYGQAHSVAFEVDKGKVALTFLDVEDRPAPFAGTLLFLDEEGEVLAEVPKVTGKGMTSLGGGAFLVYQSTPEPVTLDVAGKKGTKFVLAAIMPTGRVELSPTITL